MIDETVFQDLISRVEKIEKWIQCEQQNVQMLVSELSRVDPAGKEVADLVGRIRTSGEVNE